VLALHSEHPLTLSPLVATLDISHTVLNIILHILQHFFLSHLTAGQGSRLLSPCSSQHLGSPLVFLPHCGLCCHCLCELRLKVRPLLPLPHTRPPWRARLPSSASHALEALGLSTCPQFCRKGAWCHLTRNDALSGASAPCGRLCPQCCTGVLLGLCLLLGSVDSLLPGGHGPSGFVPRICVLHFVLCEVHMYEACVCVMSQKVI
jgi:hypothetical protein